MLIQAVQLQEGCGVLAVVQVMSETAVLYLMTHFNSSGLSLYLTKGSKKRTHRTYTIHYFRKCQIQEVRQVPLQTGNYISLLPTRKVQERTKSPGPSDETTQKLKSGAFINSFCRYRFKVSLLWDTAERVVVHRAPCTGHLDSTVY